MGTLAAAILAAALTSDAAAANADIAAHPPAVRPFLYYASTAGIDTPEAQHNAGVALRLVLANMSPAQSIERSTPDQVGPTLWRINLAEAQFRKVDWQTVVKLNPYGPTDRMVPADWLILQVSDSFKRPEAYYPLVFGGVTPKTRDEALTLAGVDLVNPLNNRGMIEGASGVRTNGGPRWIESRSMHRGYCWGTRDVLDLTTESDPLESPLGDFKHDGEEWLCYRYKFSEVTGDNGAMQISFLTNGEGVIVQRAPVDLVKDHTHFRGFDEIRNPGSCIQCHLSGPNDFTRNELKALIGRGVRTLADYQSAQEITRFHFSNLTTEFERAQHDVGLAVKIATGETAGEAAACFHSTIDRYEADVTLEQAAAEQYTTPERLVAVLGRLSATGALLPGRVADLATGGRCPRRSWEQSFLAVRAAVESWPKEQ